MRVHRFRVPRFQLGTLDSLVQHADDAARVESLCAGVVARVSDSIDKTKSDADKKRRRTAAASAADSDDDGGDLDRQVEEMSTGEYLRHFEWNKRFTTNAPIGEIIAHLQTVRLHGTAAVAVAGA